MFSPGQIIGGSYQIGEEIGRGGTGVVYRGWHLRLQKPIVVKKLRGAHNARLEADILKNLHHPCLPQVYDFLTVADEVYTVMDLVPGSDLEQWARCGNRLDEAAALRWLNQLLDVLAYLHSREPPILHNDIKPGNLILKPDGGLCLIDFNISTAAAGGGITGVTYGYGSPEQCALAQQQLQGREPGIALDARSDLYSLAATFYHLATGRAPCPGRPVGSAEMPPLAKCPGVRLAPELCRILDRALRWNRALRYAGARQMQQAVQRYRRYRGRYRQCLLVQALSWCVGLALAATGVFFLAGGVRRARVEKFQTQYDAFYSALAAGEEEKAFALGSAILSDAACAELLQAMPDTHAQLLHSMGDYYDDKQQYDLAAEQYRAAAACRPTGAGAAACYRDAVLACAQAGDLDGAYEMLAVAQVRGVAGPDLLLAQAGVALAAEKPQECLEAVGRILTSGADTAQCAEACRLAARAAPTAAAQIEWLQKAVEYEASRPALRQLGAAAYACAQETPQQGQSNLALAAQCYERLCAMAYPSFNDRLNLALIQRARQNPGGAAATLRELLDEAPQDFRVLLQLALCCYDQQDAAAALRYCQAARAVLEDMSATRYHSLPEMELQQLEALERALAAR